MSYRRMLALLALLATPAGLAPVAGASTPPERVLSFDVLRNGKPIGSQTYTIRPTGESTEVEVRTEIEFRLGFIPLYAFRHESVEVWRDGRLERLRSRTDDNGTGRDLTVARGEGGLLVSVDGTPAKPVGEAVPASLWNPAATAGGVFLDTVDGSLMQARAERPEPSRVRLEGELNRELWYAGDGSLAAVRFTAKDGSEIAYRLRR